MNLCCIRYLHTQVLWVLSGTAPPTSPPALRGPTLSQCSRDDYNEDIDIGPGGLQLLRSQREEKHRGGTRFINEHSAVQYGQDGHHSTLSVLLCFFRIPIFTPSARVSCFARRRPTPSRASNARAPARLVFPDPVVILLRGGASPPLSKITTGFNLSTVTFSGDFTAVSMHGPDEYERKAYYNGITGDRDHPHLVYRSDFLATPFPRPSGRYGHIPVKSLRGVFDTPLNAVWDIVGPQIRDIIKAHKIHWSCIDLVRFFTHAPLGGDAKGSLGPVVIWIGVTPGSTSIDAAHEVSQEILTLLQKNEVNDVVVEWREAVLHRLAGPPPSANLGEPGIQL